MECRYERQSSITIKHWITRNSIMVRSVMDNHYDRWGMCMLDKGYGVSRVWVKSVFRHSSIYRRTQLFGQSMTKMYIV